MAGVGRAVGDFTGRVGGSIGSAAGGAAGQALSGTIKGIREGLGIKEFEPDTSDPLSGRPDRPGYASLREQGGLLGGPFQLQGGKEIKLDTRGLEAIRGRALSEGPTTWEKLQAQKQGLEQQKALQGATQGAALQAAQARAQLMSRGGLRGGAAERLAGQAGQAAQLGRQDVRLAGAGQRLDISQEGERQKLDLLKQLPGMEIQALEPQFKERSYQTDVQRYNIDQALAEKAREDQAKMAAYGEEMRSWAAGKQAQAIRNQGGGKK